MRWCITCCVYSTFSLRLISTQIAFWIQRATSNLNVVRLACLDGEKVWMWCSGKRDVGTLVVHCALTKWQPCHGGAETPPVLALQLGQNSLFYVATSISWAAPLCVTISFHRMSEQGDEFRVQRVRRIRTYYSMSECCYVKLINNPWANQNYIFIQAIV